MTAWKGCWPRKGSNLAQRAGWVAKIEPQSVLTCANMSWGCIDTAQDGDFHPVRSGLKGFQPVRMRRRKHQYTHCGRTASLLGSWTVSVGRAQADHLMQHVRARFAFRGSSTCLPVITRDWTCR
jgi:hypothetical protein